MVAELGTMPSGSSGVDLSGAAQPGIVIVGTPTPLGEPTIFGTQAAGIQTPVGAEDDEDDFEQEEAPRTKAKSSMEQPAGKGKGYGLQSPPRKLKRGSQNASGAWDRPEGYVAKKDEMQEKMEEMFQRMFQ